jgi:galactofuranose transport system substrate-binding protein
VTTGSLTRRGLLLGAAASALVSCRRGSGKTVLGFSQMDNGGAWRIAETNSMKDAVAKAGGYELVVTDAQDQTAKQVSDVEDLVARRVKAIFIAPREYEGLDPVFEAAKRAKIPVFLIDREAAGKAGDDYVAFLGSDFVEQGRRAAKWLIDHTTGDVGVVELSGTSGSSVAADRAQGFRDGIGSTPRVRIVKIAASQTGEFVRSQARKVMENIIQAKGKEINAVYAHNDEMALGAIQALKSAGMGPGTNVTVVSIDGERAALESILRGELGASVESNPRFGPKALEAFEAWQRREPVPPKIILEDRLFDRSNAQQFIQDAY